MVILWQAKHGRIMSRQSMVKLCQAKHSMSQKTTDTPSSNSRAHDNLLFINKTHSMVEGGKQGKGVDKHLFTSVKVESLDRATHDKHGQNGTINQGSLRT